MNDAGNLTGASLKQTLTKCEDGTFPPRVTSENLHSGYHVAWLLQRLFHSGFSMLLSYIGRNDVSTRTTLANAGAIQSTIYSPRD